MGEEILSSATAYAEEGYTVIPLLQSSKKPAVAWKKYQNEKPTNEDIKAWFEDGTRGLAILTGRCSRLVVVDVDAGHNGWVSAKGLGLSEDLATVITGSGGGHFYYRVDDTNLRNFAGRWEGIDFRGEGGYVVAPPTKHPTTGKPYVWQRKPETVLPLFLLDNKKVVLGWGPVNGFFAGDVKGSRSDLRPVSQGGRNQAAASLSGSLIRRGVSPDRALQVLRLWNSDNNPPLPDAELLVVLSSILETHKRNHGV